MKKSMTTITRQEQIELNAQKEIRAFAYRTMSYKDAAIFISVCNTTINSYNSVKR